MNPGLCPFRQSKTENSGTRFTEILGNLNC